jgi:hypothetical protein
VSGGKKVKACGRSYFIADTTVNLKSRRGKFLTKEYFQETLSYAATFCNSMNMSVLSLESVSELFCLLKMFPTG